MWGLICLVVLVAAMVWTIVRLLDFPGIGVPRRRPVEAGRGFEVLPPNRAVPLAPSERGHEGENE